MSWIEKNADLISCIRAYIGLFQSQTPLIFDAFSDGSTPCFDFPLQSEEGLKLLLMYCSLYQDISENDLAEFMQGMYKQNSGDLFQLNRLPFKSLQDIIARSTECRWWKIYEKVPGILRSACDFFLTNSMEALIEKNSEELVVRVSGEVFFMGKSSLMKFKARLLALMIVSGYKRINPQFWNSGSLVPLSSGANRFLYFIGPLKEQKGIKLVGEEKLLYFNRFYQSLYPNSSWKVFTAFDMYKKPIGINRFECQVVVSGCDVCPVKEFCLPK